MQTTLDAVEVVEDIFRRQIDDSVGSEPNTPIEGDTAAKMRFHAWLTNDAKRSLFLRLCKTQLFWPRIRSLVGAPPYDFLKMEDDGILRAGGISRTRVHLAKVDSRPTSDIVPHFMDKHERKYRVLSSSSSTTIIPFISLSDGGKATVNVVLKRRTARDKMEMRLRGDVVGLSLPTVGTEIVMIPTPLTRGMTQQTVVKVIRLVLFTPSKGQITVRTV